jgi:uncharacterized DUF497 family protein
MSYFQYKVAWSSEKNAELLSREDKRGVGFEDIEQAINAGNILDDLAHPKRSNQRIVCVCIKNYVHVVPYVVDHKRKHVFLKTHWPDRNATEKYLQLES